ncbi:hypothetical protein Pfo_020687 [Paulownia fortunei]|nr:hypothetical protein Pfo_020687 [Paulownia fortunei]
MFFSPPFSSLSLSAAANCASSLTRRRRHQDQSIVSHLPDRIDCHCQFSGQNKGNDSPISRSSLVNGLFLARDLLLIGSIPRIFPNHEPAP